jgi:hypothetical protein
MSLFSHFHEEDQGEEEGIQDLDSEDSDVEKENIKISDGEEGSLAENLAEFVTG